MLLEVNELHAHYGAIQALRGASFSVNTGEVVVILGSNGAGKSTTLKALLGLVRPSSGTVRFEEQDITGWPPDRVVPVGLALVPEGRRVFGDQTVWDNLLLGGYSRRTSGLELRQDAQRCLERFPVLAERRNRPSGVLSGGQQQMLAISRALMARPKLLLMDEPSLGLSPKMVQEVFRIIQELKAEGMTILLVEQMAVMALALADRAYVLEQGRIVKEGTGCDLLADPQVRAAYLGTGKSASA